MQDQLNRHAETLTQVRVDVATLTQQMKTVIEKLDEAVQAREDLRIERAAMQDEFQSQLAPLTDNMNRWKGALGMATLLLGAAASAVTLFLEHFVFGGSK